MKKILILLFLPILLLTSCGGDGSIKLDVPLTDISAAVNEVLSNADKLSSVDTSLLQGIANVNPELFAEYVMMLQTKGTEIDQYAIFQVFDTAKADELKKSLKEYINILNTNQQDFNYLPEETVKLKEAEVFSAGPYIVYTIMSAEDKAAFKKVFNDVIR